MHTGFFQLKINEDTEYELSEIESKIEKPIDYVIKYKGDMKYIISQTLDIFEKHGCTIDKKNNSFTIKNYEEWFEYLFNNEFAWEMFKPTGDRWTDIALIMYKMSSINYCNMPCVCDGCFYSNIFDAIKYQIFSYSKEQKLEPLTITIVGIYDCHF